MRLNFGGPSTPCNSVPVLLGLLRLSRIVSFSSYAKLHLKFFRAFVFVFFLVVLLLNYQRKALRGDLFNFFSGVFLIRKCQVNI